MKNVARSAARQGRRRSRALPFSGVGEREDGCGESLQGRICAVAEAFKDIYAPSWCGEKAICRTPETRAGPETRKTDP